MKTWLPCLIIVISFNASAHPLEPALQNLAKAEVDIRQALQSSAGTEQEALQKILESAENLWVAALTLPVSIETAKLAPYGFEKSKINSRLVKTPAFTEMNRNAYQLDAAKWAEMLRLVASIRTLTTEVNHLNYKIEVGTNARQKALIQIPDWRDLDNLQEMGERQIECISYFSKAFSEFGIVPEEDGSGKWALSKNALERVYGTSNIDKVEGEQRNQLVAGIRKLYDHARDFDSACMPKPEYEFILSLWTQMGLKK